ncbi:tetratricopeptide repeat protein [uncultured Flavobacterium sp.]|uniref:tetratricopeptide repeat protein n=1 Tax=uncultured Flavobacterium sp. TaxID=165435 RepID=UPI0030EEE1AC|tara:strand:- start:158387 stop:159169 length:783 start_codon:yes stop_codon:yes gene_type:complete
MATYNKRGYKAPKPKDIADDASNEIDGTFDGDSTTEEVFETLDVQANKAEDWVVKNQKLIMGVVGAIVLLLVAYFVYDRFIVEPNEEKAVNEMFQSQQYFKQAVDGQATPDSLFNLALKGAEGKLGFEGIISEYSGTKSANLAQYYAGMSYLNLKDYKKAVEHLEKFSSDDEMLKPIALGAIGDSFSELKKVDDALSYYLKAAEASDNDFTSPRYLMKHGLLAMLNGKNEVALKSFKTIKEKYSTSTEAANIDGYIARVE